MASFNMFGKVKGYIATLLLVGILFPMAGSILQPHHAYAADPAGVNRANFSGQKDTIKHPEFGCFGGKLNTEVIPSCIAAGGYYLFFLPLFNLALWVSYVLNIVLMQFVVGMGNFVRNMNGVMAAWAALRDLANVFLVFITIYIGIATILGISGYGYKKLLWRVLLAALLVNFSSTFTKGIIDISNIFAMETYRMMLTPTVANPCLAQAGNITMSNANTCLNDGLAGAFWTKLKVTTIFNVNELTAAIGPNAKGGEIMWAIFYTTMLGGLLFLVMAFVFGGAAFLLVGRFVILVFLIIVSPIALVAWITGMSSQGGKWWHTLLNQSMFAPLILLMWWIALRITDNFGAYMTGSLSGAANTGNISYLGIAVYVIIIMGFLIVGIILAKNMGAYGATAVIKTGQNWSRATGAFIAGGVAANTLGRASAAASRRYTRDMAKLQEVDEETGKHKYGWRGKLATKVAGTKLDRGLNAVAGAGANMKFAGTSSFAERRMSNNKNAEARRADITTQGKEEKQENAAKILNSRFVQDNANTYGDTEAQVKARKQIADAQKVIAGASTADLDKMRLENRGLIDSDATRAALTPKQAMHLSNKADASPMEKSQLKETAYKTQREAIRDHQDPTAPTYDPTKASANERVVRGMSIPEIEDNADIMRKHPENLAYVSPDKFEQLILNKNERWTSEDLDKFNKARYAKVHNALGAGDSATLQTVTRALDNKDLELLGPEVYNNPAFVKSLSNKQYNHLTKTKRSNFSEQQLAFFEKERSDYLTNMDPQEAIKEVRSMEPEALTGLDQKFLVRDEVVQELSPRTFNEMIKRGLTKEKQDALTQKVTAMYNNMGIENKIKPVEASPIINPATGMSVGATQQVDLTPVERQIKNLYDHLTGDKFSV